MRKTRYSRQRELIYQTLQHSKEHPSAETIYQWLKPTNPALSLGTVYRNLNLLAEEGVVVRMPFEVDRYDANTCNHPHFLCRTCGNLYDVELSVEKDWEEQISGLGHQVERMDLTFHGLCKKCADTAKENLSNSHTKDGSSN